MFRTEPGQPVRPQHRIEWQTAQTGQTSKRSESKSNSTGKSQSANEKPAPGAASSPTNQGAAATTTKPDNAAEQKTLDTTPAVISAATPAPDTTSVTTDKQANEQIRTPTLDPTTTSAEQGKLSPSPSPSASTDTCPKPTVIVKECTATTVQPPPVPAPDPSPMISLTPSPILLIGLAIAVALVLGYVGSLYLARRERDALARARREIGEALKAPGIDLSEVPAELRAFEHQMNQLSAERFELEQKNGTLERRLKQLDIGPDAKRAAAISDCMLDAATAAERLATIDPDFELVGRTMELTAGLQKAADALKVIGGGRPFVAQLGELLEQGDLDAALTASAIFEKYFAERTSWRELRVGLRAVDALVIALLDRAGVQVVDVPVLSIVDSGEVRGMELSDRRCLRVIPSIQQKAARIARELRHNEVLVVDCHKPGWISDRLGSRAPQLAIFDPASWT